MNHPIQTPASNTAAFNQKRKKLFALLAVAVAAAGGGYGTYWKLVASHYVSTDNAYTNAEVAQVTSQIDGQVADVKVVNSQKIKRGDVLVTLDNTDATLNLRQAQADLARAQAQKIAAESDLERASIDLKRREALAGTGAVSGDEITHIKDAENNAHAALDAANASIAQSQARLDRTRVDLARTVIRAPVDGVVARREVQLGQRVQPSVPLLSVVPVQSMYVNANFKEVQLEGVHPGQKATMTSDLYGSDIVYHGVVEGFDGGTGSAFALIPAQNATGNWIKVVQRLPVRIRLDPAELAAHPLRVGLSMNTTIDLQNKS
ncbi:efflux RND transporter periplasmic adaptor subunit [Paludibacterium purpuratum]|uniref:Membrane fusion protein (Multidrug efflux system) n=1 Tax=Paludibacterium purpuratum TaxID=1144873 RepID=A0A4R7B4E8_9NEIS|nr:efflux RND transporter periplasmic adaptor subunit [Paludibacterium purpuratum]TDR77854.1 membrane fusion protein (multidrug efflux system) [Paludibacterium purpuratum]